MTLAHALSRSLFTSRLDEQISEARLRDSVDLLLTMQNKSGGFASYETINGPKILEWINPAEVFGDIMIEYDYPECAWLLRATRDDGQEG
jgi:squalene cyclase